ncbi:MAG: dTDP-4-dehydrorhamnose 3,5-epimerase [Chthoniobacterales bacterium]|nr:dTDP-4-dehydrorhamnose 3,5-epimerase [Chthoniobacterales bacterium]
MRFTPLALQGAYVLDIEPEEDDRGFFARSWCASEFISHGLSAAIRQCSVSFNSRKGTLRGMHYQAEPDEEVKVIRCTAGAVYDVLVDVRLGSATLGKWVATELSAENRRQLYIPSGIAHGFQTLTESAELYYQISTDYAPESARGLRWDDPSVRIAWPDAKSATISERDRSYPDFVFLTSAQEDR